jgi:hypothetical protein
MCNKYVFSYTDTLSRESASYFLRQFRTARTMALRDAEAFDEIIFVVEKIGFAETMGGYSPRCVDSMRKIAGGQVTTAVTSCSVKPKPDLDTYRQPLDEIAKNSALAYYIPGKHRTWHTPFYNLYEVVRAGRNDAMHQGVFARHLTNHAVELALIFEDALMSSLNVVADFMVREPVCAQQLQPLSFARQQMLANSFSYLPVFIGNKWKLLSDYNVARFLRTVPPEQTAVARERKDRLATLVRDAIAADPSIVEEAVTVNPDEQVNETIRSINSKPLLVVDNQNNLVGILTSYDLL